MEEALGYVRTLGEEGRGGRRLGKSKKHYEVGGCAENASAVL